MNPSVTPDFSDDSYSGEVLSEVFHLLQAARRRRVVWYLSHLDLKETVTVRELAKAIAAEEQGTPPDAIPNEDYRPVYTNLVQHHLPALATANVVGFDADRKTVTPGPNLAAVSTAAGVAIPAIALLLSTEIDD